MGFILTQIPHIVDEVVEFKNWIMKKKGYPCPFEGCKAVLSRPGRLADHMHTHTGELPYKCNVPGCTKGYNSKSSLRRHLQESHEGKATLYTTLLRCPHPSCMRLLSSRFNLQRHYQRLHANQSKFMCQYCDKRFKTQIQLQRHVYHHTGIPPLRCPTCSAGFVTERDLNRHQRGHRKWVCEVNDCGRVFLHWKTYRKHLSVDHSGVFQCDECKKTFRTKNAVRLHVACHLDDDDRPVLHCPYESCERFYFHKKNLKQHILFWHEEKGFDCKECGKKLSTNAKLKQHMLMHAPQERPVQPKKRTLPRKKRKDAGIPHQSMAAKLSGATIPHEEEKLLIRSEYESTIEIDPFAETGVTTYSTCLAAKQRASAKRKDILDVDSEKLKQGSKDDFKDVLASASPGTIMSGSDCVRAHDEVHKISDIENGKESSECDVDPSVLEQTSNMLNGKNNDTQKNEKEEPCGSDDLCKNKKEALDENVAMDAFHGQNHEKVFLAHLSDVWQFSGGILPLVALHDSEVVVPSLSQNSSNGAEMPSATVLMYQNTFQRKVNLRNAFRKIINEYRQVYNLKKWVLVMTGMMELLCPVVCSESPSRASNTP